MSRAMKDSGIPWIGEIPSHWEVAKSKYYCDSVYAGGTPDTNKMEYYDGDIPWLPSGACQNNVIIETNKFITQKGFENCSTKWIPSQTTLMAMTGATCANVGYTIFATCANQSVVAYVPRKSAYSKYLFYALQAARKHILTYQTGGAQAGINVQTCKNIIVPFISLSEQQAIADFLDKKCSEIDELISLQEKIIEELKAYKQLVITEAVTKGLNPDAPMKDSGIEWIGKIPDYWEVRRLKFVAERLNEKVEEEHLPYIGLENIESFSENYIETDSQYDTTQANLCREGDVIFGKLRPYLGKARVITELSCCSSEFIVLKGAVPRYLRYLMLSNGFIEVVNASTYGTKMPRANAEFILNVSVVNPPVREQQAIAEYLDEKCSEIDSLIALKQKKIEYLKEYKKSIIYEYTTGKKEMDV